jgi:ketosteroid isomerase-like protein
MKRNFLLLLFTFVLITTVRGQTAPDAPELTKLLNEFLAATNDPAMHERFWADDLIYTRSAGRRVSKAEVLKDVRSAPAPKPGDPKTVFTAEDVRIQQYGNTAIVAFQLVGTSNSAEGTQIARFLNSGTFVKRNGKWQVVNWQATRMARAEADSKNEVEKTLNSFFNAMLQVDAKKLASIADNTFSWTHTDGRQVKREQMIAELVEGRLKYAKLENSNMTISVNGDTAIVRGDSLRQRLSIPETPGTGDPAPFMSFYTVTFVNQGGQWKAIAMHTSRPRS